MATRQCGCGTVSCNCVIRSADGTVDITGTGSPTNPYDLSVADFPLTGRLQVLDTPSVDLTLDGSGSTEDPWVLSAESTLSLGDLVDVDTSNQTVGYVLGRNASGDFEMQPAPTAPPGTIMTDASIDGDGSAGVPLAVHDYDRIAWLNGADNLPNEGDLVLGEPDNTTTYSFTAASHQGTGTNEFNSSARYGISNFTGVANTPPAAETFVRNTDTLDSASWRYNLDGQVQKVAVTDLGGIGLVRSWFDPWKMWSTRVIINGNGTDRASVTVNFPNNWFTDLPAVMATHNRTAASSVGLYAVSIHALTEDECDVVLQRVDGGTFSTSHGVGLLAVQMDPA